MTLSSSTPPKDSLKNGLPRALAIDLPIEVLPTPGGPAKRMIEPLVEPFRAPTAMNSMILSLTSLSPSWSLSRISRAFLRLMSSLAVFPQGMVVSTSR